MAAGLFYSSVCSEATQVRPNEILQRPRKLLAWVVLIGSAGLGSVLLVSSVHKLQQPYDFLAAVYDYSLVGRKMGVVVATIIPWAEFVTAVCLLSGFLRAGALIVANMMFLLFTGVQASILMRGLPVGCGCFVGESTDRVSVGTFVTTIVLLLGAVTILVLQILPSRRPPASSGNQTAPSCHIA